MIVHKLKQRVKLLFIISRGTLYISTTNIKKEPEKMAKAKAKITKKKKTDNSEGSTVAGLAILVAGLVIIGIAVMQKYESLQLVLIGFGSALLVVSGVLLGSSAKRGK